VRGAASSAARRRIQRAGALDLVMNSGLFDPEWYLRTYSDVADAGIDPLQHYMGIGWRQGRDPGPEFGTSSYLKANPDVARAKVNPLLHYIEFGHFEGRGSSAHRPEPTQFEGTPPDFGPAAPCASFSGANQHPTRWRRAYQLEWNEQLFCIGTCSIGYAPGQATRGKLKSSFSLLELLSGCGERTSPTKPAELPHSTERLLDAWYVNTGQLRTRWHGKNVPFVVRAFQRDPLSQGKLCMVGEGLAASGIDAVDFQLKNPFFPVLLVFASPDGTLRGARMLAFPSLCRGGLHYAELLYSSGPTIDPVATGELLASRLLRILEGATTAAIHQIEICIGAADGHGQLFQSDFQLWLEKVMKIGVKPFGPRDSRAAEYLEQAVTLQTASQARGVGASLRIDHDMVPTIASLTEPNRPGESELDDVVVPILLAGTEPSQPSIAVEPGRERPVLGPLTSPVAPRWPRLMAASNSKLPDSLPAAAITFSRQRTVSEAALFMPIANTPESLGPRGAVSWIIESRGWPKGGLAQAVHALSRQSGGEGDHLYFLGVVDPLAQSIARESFDGRLRGFDKLEAAILASRTPFIGFAGSGVILHDRRCAAVLTSLLHDERVATASCAVVEVMQSGMGWNVIIADGGAFATPSGAKLDRKERDVVVASLWGSSYPVTLPTRHLWFARNSLVTAWCDEPSRQLGSGLHICTSTVSASHIGSDSPTQVPSFVPRATDERSTRVRSLFG
jgi:hypothetical protein